MAKDDYHVIVYKILSYLYKVLKASEKPDLSKLSPESFGIEEPYWEYIFIHLFTEELIEGVTVKKVMGRDEPIIGLTNKLRISPKGIEYISENSFMAKVRNAIKDFGGLIP